MLQPGAPETGVSSAGRRRGGRADANVMDALEGVSPRRGLASSAVRPLGGAGRPIDESVVERNTMAVDWAANAPPP